MATRGRMPTAGLGLFWMLLGGLACAEPEADGNGALAASAPAAQEVAPAAAAQTAPRRSPSRLPLDRIRLPPGFAIEVYTEEVPGARSLALSPAGVLYVGTRQEGKVYAVVGREGRAERVVTIASGLETPNGVAWKDGALYVAEVSRILRYPGIDGRLDDPPRPEVVSDAFPGDRHHGWKFIAFGPDGRLYVPVGAPCNVCDSENPIYATITRLPVSAGGGRPEIYAGGIRNTVGFDWQPDTGVLWFTENGADMMGDDVPPDELNRAPQPGLDFGYPRCHGKDIRDPRFGQGADCGRSVAPAIALGPHVAALGMRFYTGRQFPAEYRGQVFIAEHGSWNRSQPIGYRVTLVKVQGDRALSYEPFAEGWLGADGEAWGRPVDLLVAPDGSLLLSDDRAGAIYRISHRGRR